MVSSSIQMFCEDVKRERHLGFSPAWQNIELILWHVLVMIIQPSLAWPGSVQTISYSCIHDIPCLKLGSRAVALDLTWLRSPIILHFTYFLHNYRLKTSIQSPSRCDVTKKSSISLLFPSQKLAQGVSSLKLKSFSERGWIGIFFSNKTSKNSH